MSAIQTLKALCRKLFGASLHAVDEGRVYRVARGRMSDAAFEELLACLGIRTAVDLRRKNSRDGVDGPIDFRKLGVRYENEHVRSSALPFPKKLQNYVEILDRLDYPALLYCKRGTDKSGFGSMLYLMLVKDVPWRLARRQLAFIPYGHKKRRHEGPWEFMKLLELDEPIPDLRDWIRERYPEHFRRLRGDEEERAEAEK